MYLEVGSLSMLDNLVSSKRLLTLCSRLQNCKCLICNMTTRNI